MKEEAPLIIKDRKVTKFEKVVVNWRNGLKLLLEIIKNKTGE